MDVEKYFENLDDVIDRHPFWKIVTSLEFDPEDLKAGKRIAVSGQTFIRHFRHQVAVVSIERNKDEPVVLGDEIPGWLDKAIKQQF